MTTNLTYARTQKNELSFAGENLLRNRHKIHPYPAMLHPLLVDYLIDNYAEKNDTIYDPFCGSGMVLLQSNYKRHNSIGFDINPLALLIAKVKTTSYDIKRLKKEYKELKKSITQTKKTDIPDIKNIDYWYSKEVANDLGSIRYILKRSNHTYKDFFTCSFAFICRHQSWTRNGEFKRYRMAEDKIAKSQNNVIEKFFEHIEAMIDIIDTEQPKQSSLPILANSENQIDKSINYDLVITSPPYGDSRTTVAYGEYSSFGAEWTNDLNNYWQKDLQPYLQNQGKDKSSYKVDKECMGKTMDLDKELTNHPILTQVLEEIEKKDKDRAEDVRQFFNGYLKSIRNVVKNLNSKGKVCYVVGNRTVKDISIPMDQITASFLESFGMQFESIFVRTIHNKIMPSQVSPTNVVDAKTKTMTNEYVVVCRKR